MWIEIGKPLYKFYSPSLPFPVCLNNKLQHFWCLMHCCLSQDEFPIDSSTPAWPPVMFSVKSLWSSCLFHLFSEYLDAAHRAPLSIWKVLQMGNNELITSIEWNVDETIWQNDIVGELTPVLLAAVRCRYLHWIKFWMGVSVFLLHTG